jgi:aspartate carbamoyltransferase catalytic subunit
VVRSNVHLLQKMGAEVVVAGPRTMMMPPAGSEGRGVEVRYSLDEAIEGADVVMMLRIQLERQGRMLFPSTKEYFRSSASPASAWRRPRRTRS